MAMNADWQLNNLLLYPLCPVLNGPKEHIRINFDGQKNRIMKSRYVLSSMFWILMLWGHDDLEGKQGLVQVWQSGRSLLKWLNWSILHSETGLGSGNRGEEQYIPSIRGVVTTVLWCCLYCSLDLQLRVLLMCGYVALNLHPCFTMCLTLILYSLSYHFCFLMRLQKLSNAAWR